MLGSLPMYMWSLFQPYLAAPPGSPECHAVHLWVVTSGAGDTLQLGVIGEDGLTLAQGGSIRL